jgi:predicted nucleotidyltransferase component of viral defense system
MLVFKGGTVLKKCYFSNDRFSEGPDFSSQPGVPISQGMESAFNTASRDAAEMVYDYALVQI